MRGRCASALLGALLASGLGRAVAVRADGQQSQSLVQPAVSQPPHQPPVPPSPAEAANQPPNGISVGRPKIFDNRTLTLMLEALSETLRNLQVIDPKTIATAFGLMQGSQSRDVSSSLTIATTPTPASSEDVTTNSGLVNSAGNPLPDTTTRKTTSNTASVTPQIPALDAAATTMPGFNPQFGENASDLLSDQVSLSYQIFNLRMILERSLSDRLVSLDNADRTRLQAVLGFNVTIDAPRTAEDAVAVVEITLAPEKPASGEPKGISASDQALSLVALMPQEKTYNASALSTRSNAFGGAAVVKMIHVGYNQRSRGQTFYLYRDADTIAYERMDPGDGRELKFGWMFRPVLGQKAVSPGLRQLFAVVSLPRQDVTASDPSQSMTAKVRTYWKKYDRDTLTSFTEDHVNRAAALRYALSLSLAKPQIFESRYLNTASYSSIEVKPTARYQQGLSPTINRVGWEIVGPKTVVVSVEGNNFFTGTQVAVGGKTYVGGGDGLVLKSNQAFDLTTSLDALASGNGVIVGRYGAGVALTPDLAANAALGALLTPPKLLQSTVGPALGGTREFTACFDTLPVANAPGRTRVEPILSVNSIVVPPPYSIVPGGCAGGTGTALIASVPADAATDGEGEFKLTWPFLPLRAAHRVYNPASAVHVSQIGESSILLTNDGPLGFLMPAQLKVENPCWAVLNGTTPLNLPTTGCKNPAADATRISDYAVTLKLTGALPDKFVVVSPLGGLLSVEPQKKAPPPETKPIQVQQGDSVWIDVSARDAGAVKFVDANQLKLPFRRVLDAKGTADSKKLQVQLTRDLTTRPGTIELTFVDAANKPLGNVKVTIVCTHCDKEGNN